MMVYNSPGNKYPSSQIIDHNIDHNICRWISISWIQTGIQMWRG